VPAVVVVEKMHQALEALVELEVVELEVSALELWQLTELLALAVEAVEAVEHRVLPVKMAVLEGLVL